MRPQNGPNFSFPCAFVGWFGAFRGWRPRVGRRSTVRFSTAFFSTSPFSTVLFSSVLLTATLGSFNVVAWADSPSGPSLSLSAEASVKGKGNAGGGVRATQYGVSKTGPCMGWIPETPQHSITLEAQALTHIEIHSTTDTTLILVGTVDGTRVVLCSDDVDGNDPELNEVLEAGDYQLYVGTWNAGTHVPFTMRIRTTAP